MLMHHDAHFPNMMIAVIVLLGFAVVGLLSDDSRRVRRPVGYQDEKVSISGLRIPCRTHQESFAFEVLTQG